MPETLENVQEFQDCNDWSDELMVRLFCDFVDSRDLANELRTFLTSIQMPIGEDDG